MSEESGPTKADVGAAMMAWYAEAIRRHPAGLVSQAQAAAMLAVTRMSVTRLVARGYLRAVHFPRPPDVAGLSVGRDDPTWRTLARWLGIDPDAADAAALPKACYVAFSDVVKLWHAGQAGQEFSRNWEEVLAELGAAPAAEASEGAAADEAEATTEVAGEAEADRAREDGELETWML